MNIEFYKETIDLYNKKKVSQDTWDEFYEIMFKDIVHIKPEDLVPEQLELFKLAETHFVSIEVYEKANALKQLTEAANMVFEARKKIEEIKISQVNKNQN